MRSRRIEHRGVRILYAGFHDFGQGQDGLSGEIRAVSAILQQEPEDSVRGIVDVPGAVLSSELAGLLKETVPVVVWSFIKTAVIVDRITGFKKVILDAISRMSGQNAMVFDDAQDVTIRGLGAQFSKGAAAPLRLQGARTSEIVLAGGDLPKAGQVVSISPEVPKGAFVRKASP